LFSIGTGAMFSPPAVIIISEEEHKTKQWFVFQFLLGSTVFALIFFTYLPVKNINV
jgi:hypothetical protein